MSWPYTYDLQLWPALITFALVIYLGWYSWRLRSIPAAKPFAIACLFGVLWTLGTILQISAVDLSTKAFWLNFQTVWQLPTGVAVTCFILAYAGLGRWLNRRNIVLLSLVPLMVMLVIVTNDLHHLIWTGFQMNGSNIDVSSGRVYWVFISYVYLLGLVNIAVLLRLAVRSPGYRWPVVIILSGQIIARIGYTLDKLGAILVGLGESVFFTVGVVSIAYAVACFRFNAINPIAAARTAVHQQMSEGILVLDLQGHIVDANPAAAAIIGIPETDLRQKLLAEVTPFDIDATGQVNKDGISQSEIILRKGNAARYYNLSLTPLRDRNGEFIGQLLLLHDITEQKHSQVKVMEQQRVVATLQERERLARELHDGVGQVLGYVGIQAQAACKWLNDGSPEKAESLLGRLVEVAKNAHADVRESILGLKSGPAEEWSFVPALKKYLDGYQANYGISTQLSLSDKIMDNTFGPETGAQLMRVIQEALTNARKHSGARSVRISFEEADHRVRIRIADNGSGFDTARLRRNSGNHFGMVFMRERMAEIGGSLKIDSTPGAGTIVKLEAPIREKQEENT